MANYHEMDRDALTAEKAALEQAYKEFQAKGLKLNMARGKPGPHQMDLAMDLLKMTDYTTDAGTDARNYGELEGLSEARALFADVFGAAKEFVTGFKEWLNADSQKLTNNGGNDIVAAVSALGYDGYMVALEAIKAAGSTDGTAIRDALYGVNYDGVTGNITFDQTTGDANKDMAYIKKAADGAFEFVKTQSVEG